MGQCFPLLLFLSRLAWTEGLNGAGSWLWEEKDDPHLAHFVCLKCRRLWGVYVCETRDLFANGTRLLNGKYGGCVFIQCMLTVCETADRKREKLAERIHTFISLNTHKSKDTQRASLTPQCLHFTKYRRFLSLPLRPQQFRECMCAHQKL